MSSLLALARDHLDRMSNPAYGAAVNEEYSLQLAALLQQEGVRSQLRQELQSIRDADELTSHGWMWVLSWAQSERLTLHDDVLLAVFDRWSNVFLKAAVLEVGTTHAAPIAIEALPTFLERALSKATHTDEALRYEE